MNAPPDKRTGYRVVQHVEPCLRAFSGISVGLFGSLIGVHWSLTLSALATMAIAGALRALP